MPSLPTLTVTQEQLDALLQVYGNADVYKQWLSLQIQTYALEQGRKFYEAQMNTQVDSLQTLLSDLGGVTP